MVAGCGPVMWSEWAGWGESAYFPSHAIVGWRLNKSGTFELKRRDSSRN